MSQRFVEGVGLLTIDDGLSEEEIQANIDYHLSITPKYKKSTFADGFNDTQSMIYRWWQKLTDQENEKGRWLEGQTKEWAQNIGYYDSIALEKYYSEIANVRALSSTEEADRLGNRQIMAEFTEDMNYVYENKNGDVTDVQKKYGYTPEDIGVIDGIMAMAQNPSATLGAFAGMLLKDPEMLLINFLRIPSAVARGSEMARKTITQATRIKPKYVQRMESIIGNKRAVAMAGRGAEGAVYGGVYEALHDMTFKGKVDPNNVKRGAALGALLGTAFGAVTKTTSNSWFVDRVGSKNAERRWTHVNEPAPARKPSIFDPNKVPKNPKPSPFKPVPKDAELPEGLTHQQRYEYWKNKAVKHGTKEGEGSQLPREKFEKRVANTVKKMLKQKNPDGSRLFTVLEARGLAARHHAEVLIGKQKPKKWGEIDFNRTTHPSKNRRWGEKEEIVEGRKNTERPDYEPPVKKAGEYDKLLPEVDITKGLVKTPSMGKIAKAGAIGAIAGGVLAEDEKGFMALLGALTFGLARGTVLKGINVEIAKMKQHGHKIADTGKLLEEGMERQATMVGRMIQKIVQNPKQQFEFLNHVENFSKINKKEFIETHGKEYYETVQAFHNTMEKFWKMANELNVLKDESHIKDYVTHIFGKELSAKEMGKLNQAFNELGKSKTFNFAHQRKIFKTIEEIAEGRNIVFDPVKILAGYTQTLSKVMAGKHIVKELSTIGMRFGNKTLGLAVDIRNKAQEKLAKEHGYKESEMPALKGKLIHPLIKRALEDYYKPDIGSRGLIHKASILNNAMKRVILSMSLFHAQALILSGVYAGGLTHMYTKQGKQTRKIVKEFLDAKWDMTSIVVDGKGNVIQVRNLDGKLVDLQGDFLHAELLREIVDARLGIGNAKTNELVNAGYRTVKQFLDTRLKPLGKFQDKIDKITWDGIHDHAKMFTYLTMKQRLMSGQARGLGRLVKTEEGTLKISAEEASQMAAQFANDAFGGQNFNKLSLQWEKLAIENANNPKGVFYQWASLVATPTKKGLTNWLLLSPDWTISNINIGFKGLGMTKNLGTKVMQGRKLTAKEVGEWNMYMGYMFRAGVSTSMFAYVLHSIFAEKGTEFDVQDFWMTGRLDLGNGEEMVVSKQIAEPMHWLTNPAHEGLNKGAALPKAALELLTGKQWVSLKHGGTLTGPKFDKTSARDWSSWIGNKVTPISINPFKQAMLDEDIPAGYKMFEKAVLGFGGFPKYGKPEKKKLRIY